MSEFKKRTGRVFADPDRGIRQLYQDGFLQKVSKGVYRYDPNLVEMRLLEDFTPAQKRIILKNADFKCAECGKGVKHGVELHVDHIRPKDLGGKATIENGQVLCGQHNFLKKNFNQTQLGKKLFINLYNLAGTEKNEALIKFTKEVLEIFEKNNIDDHIEWIK